MAARGFFRGHPATWDGEHWRYDDTNEIAGFGYTVRPCKQCGLIFEGSNKGEPDPCLGNLSGVTNACCGHGIRSEAYICFEGGLVIRGFTIENNSQKREDEEMKVQTRSLYQAKRQC